MKIINGENLYGNKVIVLLGRHPDVCCIADHLNTIAIHRPGLYDYFMDYPAIINELYDRINNSDKPLIITTQSSEFLGLLLESKITFVVATVHKSMAGSKDEEVYRMRVLSKEDAYHLKEDYGIDLRM